MKISPLAVAIAWFICFVPGCKRGDVPPPAAEPVPAATADDPFAAGYQPEEIKPKDWWIFPIGTINPFCQDWYSKHLVAAKEGKIHADLGTVHYRFTWLRTFRAPFIFHIKRNRENGYVLTTTKLTGKGGYEPGTIDFSKSKELTGPQIAELRNLLRKINYWELPTETPGEGGYDGAQWILEGVDNQKYHVADRWSGGVLEEIGIWFLRISEVNIPKEDVY